MTDPVFKVAAVQAAPAFLDLEAGMIKAKALIAQAAQEGARLIAFPECWLPGYPWWAWLGSPAWGMQFVGRHVDNCMTADGPHARELAATAAAHGIWVVMGYSERRAGSLYIAQMIIDDTGEVRVARRKLKATHVERTVFGEGDGSDLTVIDTDLGRLGALCCWEHINPLNKAAMYAQNEQVHIAAWPTFSLYEGKAHALGAVSSNAVSRVYALEGQCFVIAPCGVLSPEMIETLCDTPDKRDLITAGGGYAMIYGPDGQELCAPLAPDAEGLIYADINIGMIPYAKTAGDSAGHYSRPDVVRLLFNPLPVTPVEGIELRYRPGTTSDRPTTKNADAASEFDAN